MNIRDFNESELSQAKAQYKWLVDNKVINTNNKNRIAFIKSYKKWRIIFIKCATKYQLNYFPSTNEYRPPYVEMLLCQHTRKVKSCEKCCRYESCNTTLRKTR